MDNYDKNINSWTKEQFIEYLKSRGVNQSFEEYSSDDLLAIALSFDDESYINHTNGANDSIDNNDLPEVNSNIVENMPVIHEDNNSTPNEHPNNIELDKNEAIYDINEISNNITENEHENIILDENERLNLILSFCEATGTEFEEAEKILESSKWDLGSSISSHFENADIINDRTNYQNISYQNSRVFTAAASTISESHPISMNIPVMGDEDGIHPNILNYMRTMHQAINFNHSDDDDDDDFNDIVNNRNNHNINNENNRKVDEYDDEGIRRPDPVRNQRLVSGYHNISTDPLARADDPSVEWIYKPPSQLSYPGSWTDAKVVAKDDSKWLLVNIQSHTEFTSHRLNGETWNDDTIESIVRSSFLFWQRGHTSGDGINFMRMYHINEIDLPIILIIDPRTGLKVYSIKGFISPDDFSALLVEFLEVNTFDSTTAPVIRDIDTTDWHDRYANSMQDPNSPISKIQSDVTVDFNADDNNVEMNIDSDNNNDQDIVYNENDNKNNAVENIDEDTTSNTFKPNYGVVPDEPDTMNENSVKISIRYATNGKAVVRRFHKNDLVKSIFAVLLNDIPEAATREFDVVTSFPTRSLSSILETTINEAGLGGSQVIMRWL